MEDQDDSIAELARELYELYVLAGSPSLNSLVRRTRGPEGKGGMSRSTIQEKLKGVSMPKLEQLISLVEAITRHSQEIGISLPDDVTDVQTWRLKWYAMAQALGDSRGRRSRASQASQALDIAEVNSKEESTKTLGVNRPNEAITVVELLALDCNPRFLQAGQAIAIEYLIRLWSDDPLPVILGASLIGVDGEEYYDVNRDLGVVLQPKVMLYKRQLRVSASAPAGPYRLIGAVWHPKIGGDRMADLDRGYVVRVLSDGRQVPN
ncbi:hypothetical protein ACIRBZ_20210 [Streptomyces sp. NPDC094038]|uniref:hypothetical protein n=1 Tax=Streptomyces sp. NPDC094038 TaxID=3366055 RepID=UPI0038144F92